MPLAELPVIEAVAGVLVGLVATLALRREPRALVLVATSVAAAVGLVALDLARTWTLVGVATAATGALPRTHPRLAASTTRVALIVAGAVVIGLGVSRASLGLTSIAIATAATSAAVAFRTRAHFTSVTPPLLPLVLTITCAGIFVNVPDTEEIALVGAALATLSVAQWLFSNDDPAATPSPPLALPMWTAHFVALMVVLASAATGARGRPDAFIGVIGALGVLITEPIAARVRPNTRIHPMLLVAIHAAAAITIGRLATRLGRIDLTWATIAVLAATLVLLTAGRRPSHGGGRADRLSPHG